MQVPFKTAEPQERFYSAAEISFGVHIQLGRMSNTGVTGGFPGTKPNQKKRITTGKTAAKRSVLIVYHQFSHVCGSAIASSIIASHRVLEQAYKKGQE